MSVPLIRSDPPTRLCVRVGPSLDDLTLINPNDDHHPVEINSPFFTGRVAVRIRTFRGLTPPGQSIIKTTPYFKGRKREFSVQVEGRFKHVWDGDEVLFGVLLDRRLRLPPGTDVAVKFAKWIDPAMNVDLHCEHPWTMSPLICAMNIMNVQPVAGQVRSDPASELSRVSGGTQQQKKKGWRPWKYSDKRDITKSAELEDLGGTRVRKNVAWRGSLDYAGENVGGALATRGRYTITSGVPPAIHPVASRWGGMAGMPRLDDDLTSRSESGVIVDSAKPEVRGPLALPPWRFGGEASLEEDTGSLATGFRHARAPDRQKFFLKPYNRKEFLFTPDNVYGFDFYNKYLDIGNLKVSLPGFSVNLVSYWYGQPLRYLAVSKDGRATFFVVQFELVAESDL
ncbi:hypothetical protein HDU85_007296 [Gaertneriomyces sp. JEL0708]|nr:hypothetical protein HDU85_007296 [Gaertneriomyces sp. JEL0708]